MMRVSVFFLFLLFYIKVPGQNPKEDIYISKVNIKWDEFSEQLESEYDIRFFYMEDSINEVKVINNKDSVLLKALLEKIFSTYNITVSHDNKGNYFLFRDFKVSNNVQHLLKEKTVSQNQNNTIYVKEEAFLKTQNNYIAEHVTIGSNGKKFGNKKIILKGYITNESDQTTIPQAHIRIHENNTNLISDISGYYEIKLLPGNYTISANSLGMYEKSYELTIYSDGQLNIALSTKSFLLDEAVVTANQDHNVRGTNMGFERISTKAIKEMPMILGEKDVLKAALMLPGVQSVGEASSGFNVRGSPTDQNIFYINHIPLYNTSHLFGLYTTFNSDAINSFEFYKSNIPIEYGGHLSSIFTINALEGNKENFSVKGGIGPLSCRALAEGPIKDSSSSFLISLRTTYSDWILNQINNVDIKNSSASFYDALMNFSFLQDKKNKLSLFFYGSDDNSDLAFGTRNKYSNIGGSFIWLHHFSKSFFSELSIASSQYKYRIENYDIQSLANKSSFKLNHNELKLKFEYYQQEKQHFEFGLNSKYYDLENGDFLPLTPESNIKAISFDSEKAITNSFFISDTWNPINNLSIKGGVRVTYYAYLGPQKAMVYQKGMPKEIYNIVDSTYFNNNQIIDDDFDLDIRFSVNYQFSPNLSLKASYNVLHQYIFMLSNSISVSPTNKWKLCDQYLDPMKGEQISLGLYKNFLNGIIETSVEGYYKSIDNQIEYKDGAELLINANPETSLIQGNIKAYGIEFMLKKNKGKLNGWLNYTYSRAELTVNDSETGENNNNGMPYPASYEKPHAFNFALNYKITKRLSVSTNVIYSTGRPITVPTSIYYQDGMQFTSFSKRNEYRLPDYFRIDLSFNIEGNLKKHKLAHGSWSFGCYNITSRKNPYSVIFQNDNGIIKGYKISILGEVIPSISYNIKLGNYEN